MGLPNVSALSSDAADWRQRWLQACGTRPHLRPWARLRGKHKNRLLHAVAAAADDDEADGGDYLSAYEEVDIDELLAFNKYSVEHVVPRSHVNGSASVPAENDPLGWVEATRRANSRRSNLPLVLWEHGDGAAAEPNTVVTVDGDKHYVPPMAQRARLARKWLCIRATYPGVRPPTAAQRRFQDSIVALARDAPVQPAERAVNEAYREALKWANPLLENRAKQFYDDKSWRASIFGYI
jgi:hypothetical protein